MPESAPTFATMSVKLSCPKPNLPPKPSGPTIVPHDNRRALPLFKAGCDMDEGKDKNKTDDLDPNPMDKSEKKLAVFQDRLPFWPDEYYEQANPIVRSSLFSISNRRKFYEDYTPIRVVGDGTIEAFGPLLKVFDETVMMQLMQYCRGQRLTKPLSITRRQLLRELDLASSGKSYARLDLSMSRLSKAKIKISSKAMLRKLLALMTNPKFNNEIDPEMKKILNENYGPFLGAISSALSKDEDFFITMGFISNYALNSDTGEMIVKIDPLMILLLDGINTARVRRSDRQLLSAPAAIRLLEYFMSHSVPIYDQKLETYHEMLGSENDNMRKFKADFVSWMKEIESLGRIAPGWSIEDGMVKNVRPLSYADDCF